MILNEETSQQTLLFILYLSQYRKVNQLVFNEEAVKKAEEFISLHSKRKLLWVDDRPGTHRVHSLTF